MIVKLPDSIDEQVDLFYGVRDAIFAHVGYVEDWRVLPLDDQRGKYWCVDKGERESCCWADSEEELRTQTGQCFEGTIYTQRHLKKWVYRGEKLTLVLVDTHCDGNQFLMLFSNDLERPAAAASRGRRR